ncbi:MAG TPA: flagellar motor switch protein FliG [Steroidobacteraceae bacterium]|nr:flagellar motor switch protein FliG [Steroidobacteraceae bacterium]
MAAEPASGRSGVERAAILLLTLGEQDAAQVLKHLGAKDVQRVGAAMAQLASLSREDVSNVLGQFSTLVEHQTSIGGGQDEYIRKVMVEALGADKANGIIDRILRGRSSRGLEALKWMEPKAVADLMRSEHPQIAAIVLSYLEADQAAVVLAALPEQLRPEIIVRIANLEGVHPSALQELDEVLEKQFTGNNGSKSSGFGGPKVAAEILNLVGTASEGRILEEIKKGDEALSQKLQDLMFVFDDMESVDDRGMQELMREVPGDKLVIALKAATPSLRDKFFKNMSERASQMLKDDLEAKGPVKLSEVEAVQREILLIARRLSDEGKLQLGGKGGGDDYV